MMSQAEVMLNEQLHTKLDTLAKETLEDLERSPRRAKQTIRDALEEAIQYDHELHSAASA
jgi:hypothetical protein